MKMQSNWKLQHLPAGSLKWHRHFGKQFNTFLIKLKIYIPYTLTSSYLLSGTATCSHTVAWASQFIEALFKRAGHWKSIK
jgi:hypothetical protein